MILFLLDFVGVSLTYKWAIENEEPAIEDLSFSQYEEPAIEYFPFSMKNPMLRLSRC